MPASVEWVAPASIRWRSSTVREGRFGFVARRAGVGELRATF